MTNIRNDSSYLRYDLRRSLAHRRAYRIRSNDEQEEASEASRRYSTANGSLIRVEGPSKSRSDVFSPSSRDREQETLAPAEQH